MVRLLPALALFACAPSTYGPHDTTPVPREATGDRWNQPADGQLVLNPDRVVPEPIPFERTLGSYRIPLNSTPILQSSDGSVVYTVDPDNGTLVRMTPGIDQLDTVALGSEPVRLALAGSTLYATLRGDRTVVAIDAETLEILGSQHVGAEPFGIVASIDGSRVYVAVSQQDEVLELDGQTLEILARVPVPSEPRYLALTPDGTTLFVGSARGEARLTQLDVATFAATSLSLPTTQRFLGDVVDLTPRITGDLALGFLGEASGTDSLVLAVPTLYSDTVTPIPDIADPAEIPPQIVGPNGMEGNEGGYGGGGEQIDRLNPTVVPFTVSPGGAVAAMAPLFVSAPIDGTPSALFVGRTLRSYVSGLTFSPDGLLAATLEASNAVVLLSPGSFVFSMAMEPPEIGGFALCASAGLRAGPGANGTVFTGTNTAYSVAPFGYGITRLDIVGARSVVQQHEATGFNRPREPRAFLDTRTFGTSPLSEELQLGRKLFYSAADPAMGAGGVSCSTCHVDGRNDGMTWTFDGGLRQTPSLAGVVSQSEPVTWTSNVESVSMEADITTRGRMGGEGLTPTELTAIAAFVDSTRLPDPPEVVDTDAVARGAELFQQQACGACHGGEALSDNRSHVFRGTELNTPRLVGIAATAPYLFDGSAPTLRSVLELAREPGAMGSTAALSDAQLDDLEAYLRTL